ncbi:MAG: (E)-4-hydroxy-3-methylbut-2-enyl-diphosphate synthase [Verrucomicrobia bacterium]|nr:(E)-4-hydroxy-3-methylbut-2-enyl-diphosphate synthase [Verrucomicrobiota bacterium]MDA1086796.1 (E)-4-hydroxy-3-methylbut-2-enyl-diphosphate synthase [Verrucomicrobiota bacterium]
MSYCHSPYAYGRRKTREVTVGENHDGPVVVGGDNPIRVQSMTTTNTRDTDATVAQVVRLVEAGCEIVRITAPKVKDAQNLAAIRQALLALGIKVPLVADIHFLPSAAMEAAKHVDKVRVNPGNFADRKVFQLREYSDAEYEQELERIDEIFKPLIARCREYGRAMRIGTNHGSLSDRVMSRFGDSPEGMVESALEFVRICETHDYREIILSMKASNPAVMIEANRLLVARMNQIGMDYPIHLGVTEAGDGEDGRIKSAVGIGSLLADGIGDTIRVSLTEEPEFEVPVCFDLIRQTVSPCTPVQIAPLGSTSEPQRTMDPFSYARRAADSVEIGPWTVGGNATLRVEARVASADMPTMLRHLREVLAIPADRSDLDPKSIDGHDGCDIAVFDVANATDLERLSEIRRHLEPIGAKIAWAARIPLDPALAQKAVGSVDKLNVSLPHDGNGWQDDDFRALAEVSSSSGVALQWSLGPSDIEHCPWTSQAGPGAGRVHEHLWSLVQGLAERCEGARLIFGVEGTDLIRSVRYLADQMTDPRHRWPICLTASTHTGLPPLLSCSVDLGALLCDGIGDVVQVEARENLRENVKLAYNILQASGRRITKTEFISCPSCGRTLFDLQTTTERIKSQTSHLKNVRIAIMGCIVNGPGEMADADFGYVGAGTRRISLYVGKDCVSRDIPEDEADQRLIELIKAHGKWVEPREPARLEYEHV